MMYSSRFRSCAQLDRASNSALAFPASGMAVFASFARSSIARFLTVAANCISSIVCFMGLPFASVLWSSQFKAAGNPTPLEIGKQIPNVTHCVGALAIGRCAGALWVAVVEYFFRGVACDSSAALCPPGVRAQGGLFLL